LGRRLFASKKGSNRNDGGRLEKLQLKGGNERPLISLPWGRNQLRGGARRAQSSGGTSFLNADTEKRQQKQRKRKKEGGESKNRKREPPKNLSQEKSKVWDTPVKAEESLQFSGKKTNSKSHSQ